MDQPTATPQQRDSDELPPLLGSWQRLYGFVILLHTLIIALFYWFTQAYS
jgi:hypothetical protein